MPNPKPGEEKQTYVARFMASAEAQKDFPDEKQRAAVAYSKFGEKTNAAPCRNCGAAMNALECSECGLADRDATPPIESLRNLCPVCRHQLEPGHGEYGCSMPDCPCAEQFQVIVEPRDVLPNAARFERQCPSCDAGTIQDAAGNDAKCPKCKGTGVESVAKLNAADDKGPFDQPNPMGCNGCDDSRAPLNKEGYCARCASEQGPRQNANEAPAGFTVVAQYEDKYQAEEHAGLISGGKIEQGPSGAFRVLAPEKKNGLATPTSKKCPECDGPVVPTEGVSGSNHQYTCKRCGKDYDSTELKNADASATCPECGGKAWLSGAHLKGAKSYECEKCHAEFPAEKKNGFTTNEKMVMKADAKCPKCGDSGRLFVSEKTGLCDACMQAAYDEKQNTEDPIMRKNQELHKRELAAREKTLAIAQQGGDKDLIARTEAEIKDLKSKIAAADASLKNGRPFRCSCGGTVEAVAGQEDRYECDECGQLFESDDWRKDKLKAVENALPCSVCGHEKATHTATACTTCSEDKKQHAYAERKDNSIMNADDRAITDSDIQSAQRGLNMLSMSIPDLRDLLAQHQGKDMFASKVIVKGAEQMLASKRRMGAAENQNADSAQNAWDKASLLQRKNMLRLATISENNPTITNKPFAQLDADVQENLRIALERTNSEAGNTVVSMAERENAGTAAYGSPRA